MLLWPALFLLNGVMCAVSLTEQCQPMLEEMRPEVSVSITSLVGSWVSLRCETRPGPRFVLRHYQWSHLRSGQVTGLLYHYADPDCRQPLYTIIFQARMSHSRPSWVLPGQSGCGLTVESQCWYNSHYRWW